MTITVTASHSQAHTQTLPLFSPTEILSIHIYSTMARFAYVQHMRESDWHCTADALTYTAVVPPFFNVNMHRNV